ncbi:MAG: hypothetical protein J0I30_00765, partial [Burkholderiales bacterium]|nr:hypothetical protein [Burkholderiales bacterium]
MASVSSLGLSGLPLTDLLDKLKTNESQILNTIKDRQTAAETKLSAYSKLKDAVASLRQEHQVRAVDAHRPTLGVARDDGALGPQAGHGVVDDRSDLLPVHEVVGHR